MGCWRTAASSSALRSAMSRPSVPAVVSAITRPSGPRTMAMPGKVRPRPLVAGLVAGDDEDPVVEGPRRQVPHPRRSFLLRGAPGGGVGHEDHVGPLYCHAGRKLGEVGVVAELDSESESARLENGHALAGRKHRLLGGGDVQLAVPAEEAGRCDGQVARVDPAALGLLYQAGQDHYAVMGGHGAQTLRDPAGHGFGLLLDPCVSPVSGDVQLREADDPRTLLPGRRRPSLPCDRGSRGCCLSGN